MIYNDPEMKCKSCLQNCAICENDGECEMCDEVYYFETMPGPNYHKCIQYKNQMNERLRDIWNAFRNIQINANNTNLHLK